MTVRLLSNFLDIFTVNQSRVPKSALKPLFVVSENGKNKLDMTVLKIKKDLEK